MRIKKRFIVTNMIGEKKLDVVKERIKPVNIDFLCNIPPDREMEEAIFETGMLPDIQSLKAIESIDLIINKIGGNNGNS